MIRFKYIIFEIIFLSFIVCMPKIQPDYDRGFDISVFLGTVVCNSLDEFIVTATMYNPTHEQTDSTPNQTADGTIIDTKNASSYRYVALSRDLLSRWGGPFNYDDIVCIQDIGEYSGLYKVKDTMNSIYTQRVDILKTKGHPNFMFEEARLSKWEGN